MSGFQIPRVVPKVRRSVRFPRDVVTEVEKTIGEEPCTFSAFVVAAVRHALDQLQQGDQDKRA